MVRPMADKGSARRPAGQDLGGEQPGPDPQRGARRARRLGQDHLGGDAARLSGGHPPGRDRARRHDRLRLRRGRAEARPLHLAGHRAGGPSRDQDQPHRHPRVRRLRRRRARGPAGRRLRAVRDRGQRRRGRRDPRPVARVRRRRDAASGGDHQARPGPRRLRRRTGPGTGGLRRQGDAALRARRATATGRSRSGLLEPGDGPSTTCAAASSRGSSRSPRTRP